MNNNKIVNQDYKIAPESLIKEQKKMYEFTKQEKYLTNNGKYNFMTGDPIDFKPYYPVIKELKKVLKRKDLYEYQPSNGTDADKKVIVDYLKKIGIKSKIENITFTYSTTHAFDLIFKCLGNKNDGVLIPIPSYALFDMIPVRYGLNVVPVPLNNENNWLINPEELENIIIEYNKKSSNSKIKFLYNMNPYNPTGKVMSINELNVIKQIKSLAIKYDFYIIDDLVYRDLTYNRNFMPIAFSEVDMNNNNIISLFGLSKSYNLASIRSGFMVSNKDITSLVSEKIFEEMDSISIVNIKSITSAFNIENHNDYKNYFKKLIKMYKENFEILKILVGGIDLSCKNKYKRRYIKKILKNVSKKDIQYAFMKMNEISFTKGLEDIESGYFALLDIKTSLNYYQLYDNLFEKASVKVICGNSIMCVNNDKKIIRINYAVPKSVLINGIINIKKYLINCDK